MKIKLSLLALLMCSFAFAHKPNYIKSDIRHHMTRGDMLAILIVHFGSSHADARQKSLDTFTKEVQAAYPNYEVREAYSSRIILRILRQKGIKKMNPEQMLMQLYLDGYTHVVVQTTSIIHGSEVGTLRHDIFNMKKFFKEIRLGKPLLYHVEDAQKTVRIITQGLDDDKVYLFGGHGTHHPITASYAMVDMMLKEQGHANMYVATVEGYPEFKTIAKQIKEHQAGKEVHILPLMFVAGDHAKNDLQNDWCKILEQEGIKATAILKGLGEYPEIRQLLLEHLDFAFNYRSVNISDKKKTYATE